MLGRLPARSFFPILRTTKATDKGVIITIIIIIVIIIIIIIIIIINFIYTR